MMREVQFLVLDEADQMLQVGFAEDVETILEKLPAQRQSMMFSATMPNWIKSLTQKHAMENMNLAVLGATGVPGLVVVVGGFLMRWVAMQDLAPVDLVLIISLETLVVLQFGQEDLGSWVNQIILGALVQDVVLETLVKAI
ncbi:hypothetical protein J1N35_019570 [Gossypium stocksii]|uniref:Helicase ATP-binding domain-containing protein n=1 Tax=Gossypium stocksii TaxID=47602 RepID=A0A9D3VTI1_9ROSI|nr:hypothetical protein J1N35_019570 [Gossypium stocksii]